MRALSPPRKTARMAPASPAFPRPGGGIALILERQGLGDAFIGLHFLRALKRAFPDERIGVIVSEGASPYRRFMARIVEPLVDTVVERACMKSPLLAAIRNMRALPRVAVAFDHRSNFRAVLLARLFFPCDIYLCAAPGWLLSSRRPRGKRPRHRLDRLMRLLETLTEAPVTGLAEIIVAPEVLAAAERLLPPGPRYVGLAPGATRTDLQRRWPLERFVALAGAVAADGAVPAVLLGPAERDLLAPLRAQLPAALFPGCDVATGQALADVELSIALGRRLAAAVANDCGTAHLLAGAGTPLIVLFGPSDARRWGPVGERVEIIAARQFGGNTMDAIPFEIVRAALGRMLAGAESPSPRE